MKPNRPDGAKPLAGSAVASAASRGAAALLVGLAAFYRRFISPLKPPVCRFRPTCSEYFIQAIRAHGPARGAWMGLKRIARCHPFHPGGYDPVDPEKRPD